MELYSVTLRPGRVLEVNNEDGTIKASAPGLFSDQDEPDKLPPIYPFFTGNSNQWSQPNVDDEVWILNNKDNPLQLHWFKKDDTVPNNIDAEIPMGGKNVEVVCNRESGMGWASIYFEDGTGWMILNNGSYINIKKDGTIVMTTGIPKQTISIGGKGISLGTEGQSEYSAVLGEELVTLLNELLTLLAKTGQAALSSPYTASLGSILVPMVPKLAQSVSGILSSNVTLD